MNKKKFIERKYKTSYKDSAGLVSYNSTSEIVVAKIKLIVTDDLLKCLVVDSACSLTAFQYQYINSKNDLLSSEDYGLIDNKMNLFIPPPRMGNFRILEINPFPFYYLDRSKRIWEWDLREGGNYWPDIKWKIYKGELNIKFIFERLDDEILNTSFGKIKCSVVNGTGISQIGDMTIKTQLKYFYHLKYGFLKLEYINVDETKLVMELIEMKK